MLEKYLIGASEQPKAPNKGADPPLTPTATPTAPPTHAARGFALERWGLRLLFPVRTTQESSRPLVAISQVNR